LDEKALSYDEVMGVHVNSVVVVLKKKYRNMVGVVVNIEEECFTVQLKMSEENIKLK
jgi:ribosomal protein L21E